MDRVGVIGLGKMGLPIAMNLMSRGFHVTGYRRSGSPELVKAGGTVAASAAEVAAQADVILSIVPTAEDVEEVICGPQGTLSTLNHGTIHIEMSTIDVDRKARLRDKANNALPFVPSMTYCEVTQRHSDTVFDRDIDFRGERFTERITLEQHDPQDLFRMNYNIPPAC